MSELPEIPETMQPALDPIVEVDETIEEMPAMWEEIQTWQLIFSTSSIHVYERPNTT